MEKQTYIRDVASHIGTSLAMKGWCYNFRSSGGIFFLQLRDGSGTIQGVVNKKDVDAATWAACEQMTIESSVVVTGNVKAEPRAPSGFELELKNVTLVQRAEEYPISKKEHKPAFLLSNRHLWLRAPRQLAILRVRDAIFRAMIEHLHTNGYIRIDTPILSTNACEGSTTLFSLDYFGEKAYLSQSGQLYLEAAIMSCGRGYDFGPVFRAEKSKTRRHLTEFWMMDAEAAFVDLEGNMAIQQALIQHVVRSVLETMQPELTILERDQAPLVRASTGDFLQKTHTATVEELRGMGSAITDKDDLGAEDETILMTKYDRPMFVTHYPKMVKAFYMKGDGKGHARCADLLLPEGYGEVIGGSQREDDYDALLANMSEHGVSRDGLEWYLDLRKYGSVPHSGFGVGLERLVAWICGLKHVRETIPFPRMINRLRP